MKKNKFVNLRIIFLLISIITSVNSSIEKNNIELKKQTNDKSILGKYIANRDLQKIISDYVGLKLLECKTIDAGFKITSAKINNKDIICVSSYLSDVRIFDSDSLKCKKILSYGPIYNNFILYCAIGFTSGIIYNLTTISISPRRIGDVVFSHDGETLALIVGLLSFSEKSEIHQIEIYNTKNNRYLNTLKLKESDPFSLKFSNNDKYLAYCHDKGIRFYNIEKKFYAELLINDIPNYYAQIKFSPDDNSVVRYNTERGPAFLIKNIQQNQNLEKIKFNDESIRSASFSPNGKYIFSISTINSEIKLWDNNANLISSLGLQNTKLLAVSNDSKYLAAYSPFLITIWHIEANEISESIDFFEAYGLRNEKNGSLFFSNDNKLFLALGTQLHCWDSNLNQLINNIDDSRESNIMRNTLCCVQ